MKNKKQTKKASKKNVAKKGAKKGVKKVIKKVVKENKPKKKIKKQSIAKLVMGMIAEKKILKDSNRKRFYTEILEAVLKLNPKSKFKETHFHWYLSRFARQQRLELGLECLHRIVVDFKPVEKEKETIKVKKIKKVVAKKKLKKTKGKKMNKK